MIIIVVPVAAVTTYWLNKLITNYIENLGIGLNRGNSIFIGFPF